MARMKSIAINPLHNPRDIQESLVSCRHVLMAAKHVSGRDGYNPSAEDGRALIIDCVIATLETLEEEVDALERPARQAKLEARRAALEVVNV